MDEVFNETKSLIEWLHILDERNNITITIPEHVTCFVQHYDVDCVKIKDSITLYEDADIFCFAELEEGTCVDYWTINGITVENEKQFLHKTINYSDRVKYGDVLRIGYVTRPAEKIKLVCYDDIKIRLGGHDGAVLESGAYIYEGQCLFFDESRSKAIRFVDNPRDMLHTHLFVSKYMLTKRNSLITENNGELELHLCYSGESVHGNWHSSKETYLFDSDTLLCRYVYKIFGDGGGFSSFIFVSDRERKPDDVIHGLPTLSWSVKVPNEVPKSFLFNNEYVMFNSAMNREKHIVYNGYSYRRDIYDGNRVRCCTLENKKCKIAFDENRILVLRIKNGIPQPMSPEDEINRNDMLILCVRSRDFDYFANYHIVWTENGRKSNTIYFDDRNTGARCFFNVSDLYIDRANLFFNGVLRFDYVIEDFEDAPFTLTFDPNITCTATMRVAAWDRHDAPPCKITSGSLIPVWPISGHLDDPEIKLTLNDHEETYDDSGDWVFNGVRAKSKKLNGFSLYLSRANEVIDLKTSALNNNNIIHVSFAERKKRKPKA